VSADRLRRAVRLGQSRPYVVVAVAALAAIGLLAIFAVQLAHMQASTRDGVKNRFRDRAGVTSALTDSIFAASASSSDTASAFRGRTISERQLGEAAKAGGLDYVVILDERGELIASSPGLPADTRKRLLAGPAQVEAALLGTPFSVSDVLTSGGESVIDFVQTFATPYGRRVLVRGLPSRLLSGFIGAYLARIPTRGVGGTAYIVDSRGNVVSSADPSATMGRPVPEPDLRQAVADGPAGSFGGDLYFVAAPVTNTPWRVVLTASESKLFASVSGSRKWLPWLILAAFAVAAALALVLLGRALRDAAALSRANTGLRGANAQLEGTNSLLRRAAELARSNAELEQFASIASHDLQEPLRKVQTFAAQLNIHERDRLSEEGQDYLRRMSDAAGRMRMLIDDLLTFSRVSTQGRTFTDVDLTMVAREVTADLEITIAEAGASVQIDPLPTISADRPQMGQLLQNLIANALKFRRDGVAPTVRISGRVSGGTAEITVRDNGIGFDPQYGTRIFRAFERLHSRTDYPGTGIGLALCRKIAERHHGTITADGTPGAGAIFTFTLPIEQPERGGDPAEVPDSVPDPTATHA
jgi:signal transduction histidine kinase